MKITKLGHCCLLLEKDGLKIMTDPGSYTIDVQQNITGLDAIVITHEHQDHFHADSVKALVSLNPDAIIVTNAAVGKLLTVSGIKYIQVGDGESTLVKGVKIEGFGKEHAVVYQTMGACENTGYMIADQFYFPGDNFHIPTLALGKTVDILALPVAGPWMKMSEAIDFTKKIKPRIAFGVHDAMVQPNSRGFIGIVLKNFVPEIEYVSLADGESREF